MNRDRKYGSILHLTSSTCTKIVYSILCLMGCSLRSPSTIIHHSLYASVLPFVNIQVLDTNYFGEENKAVSDIERNCASLKTSLRIKSLNDRTGDTIQSCQTTRIRVGKPVTCPKPSCSEINVYLTLYRST